MQFLSGKLGRKIFLSYLIIVAVGVVVMAVTAGLQGPLALEQHIRQMEHLIGENEFLRQNLMRTFQAALVEVILIAALGAAVAAAVLSSFIAWRIVAPIRSMITTVKQIADGDYRQRARSVWNDELGDLALTINRMAEKLYTTEARRVELIGNVAHELRTPLSSIRSLMEGVIDGVLPADYSSFSEVQTEVARLQRLVNELEELSRVEAGEIVLKLEPVDFSELIQQVVDRLNPQFHEKEIKLEFLHEEILPEVRADRERMQQVVINILGNALQYTPSKGAVTVRLRTRARSLICSIEDTGIGIPEQEIERIFERFYRVDKSRSRSGGGSGIGLSIATHLIRAHGGRLYAESPGRGKGSIFTFSLPLFKQKQTSL